jgi:UDP-2,3-diacylglucosamine pyrophosphatase LpxH
VIVDAPVTIVISDLHLGGGVADPGDDHVYQKSQLVRFVREMAETPEGRRGDLELYINGDFLEFAQVRPEVYTLGSPRFWCSELESLDKLSAILAGHAEVFAALRELQLPGNRVTIAAGNHDVDLYWGRVQERLRHDAGPVAFELGREWVWRHEGRLRIGHGHMVDPANRFQDWANPFRLGPHGTLRLEMCPGTLFMVKFVNWLERDYPFADNIKPIQALGRLLWKEDRAGLGLVGWRLSRFAMLHPGTALGTPLDEAERGQRLVEQILADEPFAEDVARLYRAAGRPEASLQEVRSALATQHGWLQFLDEVAVALPPEEWLPVFDRARSPVLASGGHGPTLSIASSGCANEKEVLRIVAAQELAAGPTEVVVLGHTHQPDEVRQGQGAYFNPGSWTRYVEVERGQALTLADLAREETFPYQLNFVRIERPPSGPLRAEKICFERS